MLELALYVQQKSPELLTRLPDLVGSPQVWMASVSGALLLMTLRARLPELLLSLLSQILGID